MTRPSRNLDRALLAAGQALYPATGCAGLTIRQVAEAAGVNIGMFHYHFKTRDVFLRAVLQANYETLFAQLPVPPEAAAKAAHAPAPVVELVRAGLRALGRWTLDNRAFMARLVSDCVAGEPVARTFFAENFPRHLGVMSQLVARAQADGVFRPMPVSQAIAFCAGAISLPSLVLGAAVDSNEMSRARKRALESEVLTHAAVDQRIELVIAALTNPEAPRKKARP